MTHVRGAALGLSAGATAAVSYGANVIVPGSGPIVAVSVGVLDRLFGGAGEDAKRQARVDWFAQAVRQGSPLAARFLIGGTGNTGSNERPMFEKAIQALLADPATAQTMRAAQAQGPWWDTTDDRWSSRSRAAVEDELLALASSMAASSRPGMTTTAPFNWKPYAIAGGVVLLAFALPKFIAPSRSK